MNVPCLFIGQSGSGKSTSFKGLPPEKTVILNCERRPLPFKGFKQFKNINIRQFKDFKKVLKELMKDDKYEYVIIDSMTSLLEIINKYCETVFTGYNIYSEYNSAVYDVLQDVKDLEQQVFLTGIPEYLEVEPGQLKAFIKTVGKVWKYSLEKEMSVVLHTHMTADDEGNIINYEFDTRPSLTTSAKTPDGMFDSRYIPNDAKAVADAINEYYG